MNGVKSPLTLHLFLITKAGNGADRKLKEMCAL